MDGGIAEGTGGMGRLWDRGEGKGGSRDPSSLYIRTRRVEVLGQISSQNEILTIAQCVKQMIPSFTSFPSQSPQPVPEDSPSSSKHKSSKKDRKRSRERDESEKRRRRHKHKHRDRDYDLKEDERREASSSSTAFFSDCRGNRAAAHGGGTDSIRVPKYNLVARTSLPSPVKYN